MKSKNNPKNYSPKVAQTTHPGRRDCYDRGGFPGDTLDRVRKYGVNAQELVTTSSTRLLMTT